MSTLNLRYKYEIGDDWTELSFDVRTIRLQTSSEIITPCGCSEDDSAEDYYAMRIELAPIALADLDSIMLSLLDYKEADFGEVQYYLFAGGEYIAASLSLLDATASSNTAGVCFRLASVISDVL